jgi:alanyl-tRNA synthetase
MSRAATTLKTKFKLFQTLKLENERYLEIWNLMFAEDEEAHNPTHSLGSFQVNV